MKSSLKLKKRVTLYVSFFLVAGLVALQGVAGAAVNMTGFDNLSSLAGTVNAPSDVAVDQQGRIYVAETNENRVTVHSQSGNLLARLSIAAPISVAVDANGQILVGTLGNGSVSVYNSGLGFLFKLGNGDGEFDKPMDIAVDSTGIIYVVDKNNNAINTYDSTSGARIGSIGSPGNADGQLHHPISIAIDEPAGELVVLDLQQVWDANTQKYVDGARIQYFGLDGTSKRAYSKFGYNNAGGWPTNYDITMGQVTRPKQIAVESLYDESGIYYGSRIYVTDARLQTVMVYDNYDGFLGTIDNTDSPFRIPMGITMSSSGRLYVASLFTRKVEVFGIGDAYTAMAATPSTVEFNVVENGAAPPAEIVTVSNQGNAPINLTAVPQDGWVFAAATTNTLLAAESGSINITVDPTGFAPGTYLTSIAVDTGAGALETINVNLNVTANPLQVIEDTLTFETALGTTPDFQELHVESSSGSSLLWTAIVEPSTIISLNATTGNTPSTVKVYADISSLAVGSYEAVITFRQDDSVDELVFVTINITESGNASDELPVLGGNGKEVWNKKWTVSQQLPGTNLNGVSGASTTDAVAVGDNGAILHYDGKGWTPASSGTNNALNSVWSSSEADVNAVGAEGLVLNFDGTSWSPATQGSDTLLDVWGDAEGIVTVNEFGAIDGTIVGDVGDALRSVWATDGTVFFAGEAGAVYRSIDGNTPELISDPNQTEWLNGIWASSATDVFAVGENGTIVHYNGTEWTAMNSQITANINGICGTSATDVFAVGNDSILLHYNGNNENVWTAVDAGAGVNLNDIWCSDKKDVIAVGDDGTVIYGKGGKFPWTRIIIQIVDNAKKQQTEEKEK